MKYLIFLLTVVFAPFNFNMQSTNETGADGIIYFSEDNGISWENRSKGFPDDVYITDMAVSGGLLGVSTKQNGIYLYNFQKNNWEAISVKHQITGNIDVLFFFKNQILVGTQGEGIYMSADRGRSWNRINNGLKNLTIRRLSSFNNKLYAGTNGGLFSFDENENAWQPEYVENGLQVNGITEFGREIYIGTNQGAFKSSLQSDKWEKVMSDYSLHNISSDEHAVYAMTYSELFKSTNGGYTWESIQKGLPDKLYTFQVVTSGNVTFAGQWYGLYKQTSSGSSFYFTDEWKFTGEGLPSEFAVTEMKVVKNMIVIGCSERGMRKVTK